MKNYLRYYFLIIAILAIQACSFKTIYNQVDWLIVSYIEDFVSLNEKQSERLNTQIQKSFSWHRKTQLPLYTTWLQSFHDDVESGLDKTTVEIHFDTISSYFKNITSRLVDDIYVLLPNLTEQQIKEILENLSDKNVEFREEYSGKTQEELKDQVLDKLIDQFENWIGDLTAQQVIILTVFVKNSDLLYEQRYQTRLRWKKEFSVLLTEAKSGKNVNAKIKDLFTNQNKFRDKLSQEKFNQRKEVSAELIVSISRILTEEQKIHLFDKIANFKAMFLELASEINEN